MRTMTDKEISEKAPSANWIGTGIQNYETLRFRFDYQTDDEAILQDPFLLSDIFQF